MYQRCIANTLFCVCVCQYIMICTNLGDPPLFPLLPPLVPTRIYTTTYKPPNHMSSYPCRQSFDTTKTTPQQGLDAQKLNGFYNVVLYTLRNHSTDINISIVMPPQRM